MPRFSDRIMEIRKEKKLSQQDFADMIQVSKKTVYRWEKGQTVPDEKYRKELVKKLGLEENYFEDSFEAELQVDIENAAIEDVNQDEPKKKLKISFYRLWFITLLFTILIIGIAYLSLYLYSKSVIDNLHNGALFVAFDVYELSMYIVVFIIVFLFPVFLHEMKRIYLLFRNRKKNS